MLLLLSFSAFAQEEDEEVTIRKQNPLSKKADFDKPRPKIIELDYILVQRFPAMSTSESQGNSQADVDKNNTVRFKMKFPILLKDKTQLFGGFRYSRESFSFDDIRETNYDLYQRLENRNLKAASMELIFRKTLAENKYLFAYVQGSLNSDKIQFENIQNQLKTTFSIVYNVRKNPHTEFGFGAGFGFQFGRPVYFPAIIYNHDFSNRLSLLSLLPKKFDFRYTFSEKMYLYAGVKAGGASYHMQNNPVSGFENVEFRQSGIFFRAKLEREIYDFLWFSVSAGHRQPLNIFISELGKRRRDSIIDVDADPSQYFELSLFLVIPRKIYKRAKGR